MAGMGREPLGMKPVVGPSVDRDRWNTRTVFVLAAIGSAVGLGNIWRYPHIAYSGGGGAFLIPYFVALFTAGIPLLMLEFGLGHRTQSAAPGALRACHPRFEFVGWWAAFGGLFITFYYCIVMAWVCYYLFQLGEVLVVGADTLPWDASGGAGAYLMNEVVTGADGVPAGEGDFSRLNWYAVLFSGLVWAFIYFTIRRGVHSVGKVVWVTVLLPYLLLFILFFTAIGLDGASTGLNYYLNPDWTKYTDPVTGEFSVSETMNIASKAYGQIFFSLSIGFGIMMAYASFLPRRSDITNNAMITSFANSGTEFFGGLITFSVIGFLALDQGRFAGDVVGQSSLGLAFVTYPTAISAISESVTTNALIGLTFFGCLLFLGIDSAFSLVEAICAGISDKFKVNRQRVALWFCLGGWLIGVIYCTPAGLSLFDSADHYLTEYGLLIVGAIQCVAVGWFFGPKRLRRHLDGVSERRAWPIWDFFIKWFTPIVLLFLLYNNLVRELPALWDPSVAGYSGYGAETQLFGIGFVVVGIGLGLWLAMKRPTRPEFGQIGEDVAEEQESKAATETRAASGRATSSVLMLIGAGWLGIGVLGGCAPEAKPSSAVIDPIAKEAQALAPEAIFNRGAQLLNRAEEELSGVSFTPSDHKDGPEVGGLEKLKEAGKWFAALKVASDETRTADVAESLPLWISRSHTAFQFRQRIQIDHENLMAAIASPARAEELLRARAEYLRLSLPPNSTSESLIRSFALSIQRQANAFLDAWGPLMPLLPADGNEIIAAVTPLVVFRENRDLATVVPYRPLVGVERDRFLVELKLFAARYPEAKPGKPGRVAAQLARSAHPKSTVALLGTDPHGLPERRLVDDVVEDMTEVWGDRVPAAVQFRKRIVREYAAQTSLSGPGNGALLMLLFGSVVLFGGFIWGIALAMRGRNIKPASPASTV